MRVSIRPIPHSALLLSTPLLILLTFGFSPAAAGPKPESYWQVDDVKTGMKGVGKTVIKGTKVETFEAEVLGVLKNTSPGRDLILCQLSGLNLEKTGVIAGMSGSPIYIDGKLLGAVAYAWAFGKEPIAGITPFSQMHGFVESYERRDLAEQADKPKRLGLRAPVRIGERSFDAVTVSSTPPDRKPADEDGLWLVPLRTPIAATGFTPHSINLLRDRFRDTGLVPMQGGGASTKVIDDEKNTPLQAGGPLAVSLVSGDFDLSGIGTVTHLEGSRVYGWGHPFFGAGACDFPLQTGYIHTVYPRQTVSFKMGSPLRTVGVINADVSTCIAGWLDRKPDLIPVRMAVKREGGYTETFNVQMVRQRNLMASLLYSVLTNSLDMEGDLPEDLTADLNLRIELEGQASITLKDTFSGSSYAGGRAPQALYNQVATVISLLNYNSYKPVRITSIECETEIRSGRTSADIEGVELDTDTYAPGETLKATVFLRPYKGTRQRVPVTLTLPADLPEGTYTATICDDLVRTRADLRDNPTLSNPQNLDQILETIRMQASVQRNHLAIRVPVNDVGVALDGKPLPSLPSSMVHILGNTRRPSTQTMAGALVARQSTAWVIQGTESVKFTVTKNKRTIARD